jgi:hypothetical protein
VSGENIRLVETNTLVKTDFEKLENSTSYWEKFEKVDANFCTFSFTTLRKKIVIFFYNVPHKIRVFTFNLNPVS